MVEVKFRLGKRDFVWIGLIVVLVCVGFVYAYNSGLSPEAMGHSADEIEGVATIDYVDNAIAAAIVGGSINGTDAEVYNCPLSLTCDDGQAISGAWASFGCVGQMSTSSTCFQVWSGGNGCTNDCILLGNMTLG